ncbi:MAG: type I asparaginase [Mucinivorans sp.]
MKSVLLIYTGGTIGMKTDPATGVLAPFDFSQIESEVPELRKFNIKIDAHTFSPVIDSSNVEPWQWQELARVIELNYTAYDGFVVLHGTDTMSYTASALSFMLENLAKPVVFTGSQIPIGVLRTDGRENMVSAIEIAAAGVVNEVTIFFQNMLFRANRTTKYNAEYLNAFRSDNFPALAEAGINIVYNSHKIRAKPIGDFKVNSALSTDLVSLKLFPGLSRRSIEAILSIPALRAVVLESYGSGNAPTDDWFIQAVTQAVKGGLVVLNVTQCAAGSVDMTLYQTGRLLLRAGVLSGRDMTFEAASTKLMSLLGRYNEPEIIKKYLKTSICGEITI